jgi:hypothetical protein
MKNISGGRRQEIAVRSPIRRRHVTLAVLSAGLLLTAGCDGSVSGKETSGVEELFLQTAAARGPDPFTESTAVAAPKPSVRLPSPGATAGSRRSARVLPGSTPGLYGGAQALSSCDVERQVRLLAEDGRKSRAFAQGADIGRMSVPSFLRGLTPVVLRADIRMTGHGYRDGSATSFQALLQAGTGVMVDGHGMPRVRCVCGNPLGQAVPAQGGVVQRGHGWPGYRPDRVVVIRRVPQAVSSLVIVNIPDNTWLERRTGTHGDGDQPPGSLPPYGPDADITDPDAVQPPGPTAPASPRPVPSEPSPGPPDPSDVPSLPVESGTPSGRTTPDLPPEESDLYPPGDELYSPTPEQTSVELVGPGTA